MVKRISTFALGLLGLMTLLTSCVKDGVYNEEADITGDWVVTGIRSDMAYDWDGDGFTERDIYSTYNYC